MAKKKKIKHKFRNAAPSSPRPSRASKAEPFTPLKRLAYTAAGATGTALVGSFLVKEGWAPKTIATTLTAVGAGLAWKGDADVVRSVGAGTMSAAGGQLALMMLDERGQKPAASAPATASAKKPANADGLPPGSLERAFERARSRLAYASDQEVA